MKINYSLPFCFQVGIITTCRKMWPTAGLVLLLLLTVMACVVPGIGLSGPAATPTPLGDTLSFFMPTFTYNLQPGETIPGTRLHYVGRSNDGYEVTIDGLSATKRTGDSFIWNGILAPGVYANYNLRLTTAILGTLPVAGQVEIIIFNPEPTERSQPGEIEAPLHYNNIAVNYLIPVGRLIPGTTITYHGIVQQGQGDQAAQLAQLSGMTGYPYLAQGDSLVWTGNLRTNVALRYTLRAISMDEDGLRLIGTADLWITP